VTSRMVGRVIVGGRAILVLGGFHLVWTAMVPSTWGWRI
jgi:hypothetical protein